MRMTRRLRGLRQQTFRSFAERNYRYWWTGHSVSVAGTWVQRIGQDWLVLELTGSALALGISMLCQYLPVLLLSVWGGVVVDRTDTRRLLIGTQIAQAVLAAALAVLVLTGAATIGSVYVLAAALGIVTALDNPARQAFFAELVPPTDIVNAQALNSLVNNVGRLGGPALAGVLISQVGVGITFVINAASFVGVLVALAVMDVSALRRVDVTPRARGQAREGLAYVWRHPDLRAAVLLVAVVSVFGQNFRVVFPVLASEGLQGGASTYGWLTSALGVGAVAGALGSAASTTATPKRLLLVLVAFAASNVAVAAAPGLALTLGAIMVLGVLNVVFNTLGRTILHLNSAPGMRGRVMAIHSMVFLGGIPFGGIAMGAVLEAWGPRLGLVLAGAACLAGAVVLAPGILRSSGRTEAEGLLPPPSGGWPPRTAADPRPPASSG